VLGGEIGRPWVCVCANILFRIRESCLTECLYSITLLGDDSDLCSTCKQELKLQCREDRNKAVRFSPIVWIKITKDHNMIFGMGRVALGISFYL
jgi:hypothetical protein